MDEEERRDLISRLFSLMTGKLEDAAALAAEGQGMAHSCERLASVAERVRKGAEEAALLAEVAGVMVSEEPPG